jgi:hypothetical protein
MIGLTFLQIIFNDTQIYLRLVRLLKAFSSKEEQHGSHRKIGMNPCAGKMLK